jgi:hypothetical protein
MGSRRKLYDRIVGGRSSVQPPQEQRLRRLGKATPKLATAAAPGLNGPELWEI